MALTKIETMSTGKMSHPGNILLAGFGLMLLMMGMLVYFSIKQDVPLVSKQYYEQELTYQQKINARENADVYATQFRIQVAGDRFILELPPHLATHIEQGTAYFYCPSNEKMDREMVLKDHKVGHYTFYKSQLPGKAYVLKLSFISLGKSYYKEFTLH